MNNEWSVYYRCVLQYFNREINQSYPDMNASAIYLLMRKRCLNMTNRCMKICYLCIACVSLVLNYRSYNDTLATHFHHHDSFALSFDEPPVEKSSTDMFISTGVRGHEEKFVLAQLYERAKQSKEQCHAAGGGQQNNATSSYVDTSITGKALTEESSSLN
eukprot:scaffold11699_cov841-Chaetoceros_neogracile.AAC.1